MRRAVSGADLRLGSVCHPPTSALSIWGARLYDRAEPLVGVPDAPQVRIAQPGVIVDAQDPERVEVLHQQLDRLGTGAAGALESSRVHRKCAHL